MQQLGTEREGPSNYFAVPVPGTGVLCQDVSVACSRLPEMDENHYCFCVVSSLTLVPPDLADIFLPGEIQTRNLVEKQGHGVRNLLVKDSGGGGGGFFIFDDNFQHFPYQVMWES